MCQTYDQAGINHQWGSGSPEHPLGVLKTNKQTNTISLCEIVVKIADGGEAAGALPWLINTSLSLPFYFPIAAQSLCTGTNCLQIMMEKKWWRSDYYLLTLSWHNVKRNQELGSKSFKARRESFACLNLQ